MGLIGAGAHALAILALLGTSCESRARPPRAPSQPAVVLAFEGEAPAPPVLHFDLRDASEATRWRLRSGIIDARPTAEGFAVTTEGEDPFLSREISIPEGGVDQVEIETSQSIEEGFRVYLSVDGAEKEGWALDAVPLAPGSPIQVADYHTLPALGAPVDSLRIDPPAGLTRFSLVSVRVRPRARDGLLNLAGESRWCRRAPTLRVSTSALGRDRVHVSLGLQRVATLGAPAPVGHLDVRLEERGDGALVRRWQHRIGLRMGWAERIVDLDVPGPPRDLLLSLAVTDAEGAPVDACFATPRLLPRPGAAPLRPNLLLVSLDTFRADHQAHAPFLSRLASEGRHFPSTWSSSNYTLPSHASLLTGASPLPLDTPAIGTEGPYVGAEIPARFPTLAEVLRDAGYATAATTDGGMLAATFGFARGFERYHVPSPGADAALEHVRFAREIAAARPRPFFLFAHTYVAHDYHLNTPLYHDEVDAARDRELIARGELIDDILAKVASPEYTRRLYLAGIRRADEFLEDLVGEVRVASGDAPLLVIVTSDHGESFGDVPAIWHHGTSLLDEQLRVPLVVWSNDPDGPRGRVDAPTAGVDVMPSLLARLGLAVPATSDGESDRFLSDPPTARREPIIALHSSWGVIHYAVIDGALKYLRSDGHEGDTRTELCHDLAADPSERGAALPATAEGCGLLRLALSHHIASDVPRALVLRSDAPVELAWSDPHALVAVRAAMPASGPIARLADGVVAWQPGSPADALAIIVRGAPAAPSRLLLAGVDTGRAGESLPASDAMPPLYIEVNPPGRPPATAAITARHLDAPSAEWMPDPNLVEQLRALGYLPGAPAER